MKTDIVVIVQCRLSSTRLPGKAVKDLGGKTVLEWTLNSMKKVNADAYYLATDEASFPVLEPITKRSGWEIFSGPLNDVLKRYCLLIEKLKCKYVLRATADNPFLFYEAAQALCDEFIKQNKIAPVDYMTWTGLPHGSGVEIFKAESLLNAEKFSSDPYDREHVGPALYNHKDRYTSIFFKAPSRFYYPDFRTTIDTPQDYRRALSMIGCISNLKAPAEPYTTEQIVFAMKDPSVKDTVLFIPSVKKGNGTGHLRRCLACAKETGGFVYIPEDPSLEVVNDIVNEYIIDGLNSHQIVHELPEANEYSLLAIDSFRVEKNDIQYLSRLGPVLAIDEGSNYTEWCDYLLDVIPSVDLNRVANRVETGFIEKTQNKKEKRAEVIKKVLVCFGGEDPADLTVPVCKAFASSENLEVTAIISDLKDNSAESVTLVANYQNLNFVGSIRNLKEHLCEYDLVITHYGFTAFEALSAGCGVILMAPTKLHQELAKKYGFLCLTFKDIAFLDVEELFAKSDLFYPELFFSEENKSMGKFIKEISHGRKFPCPVCRDYPDTPDEIVSRTKRRTFRKCRNCGITYISYNLDSESDYQKEYFAEQYKRQYGKTYLEDFDSIKQNSFRRVNEISAIVHGGKSLRSVLDVGCAYGPFLAAASEKKWQVFGTDICKDAVDYVQNKLLFPAVCSVFPEFDAAAEFGMNHFDAITMWYVIEHFKDLKSVLQTVASLIKKGGVFAFSTPSGSGVSAKYNEESFFENSPSDHYTIWTGKTAKKVLAKYGFKIVKIVSTGHHPERFPAVKKAGVEKGSFKFNFYDKLSRIRNLGDTFEVYCKKVTD